MSDEYSKRRMSKLLKKASYGTSSGYKSFKKEGAHHRGGQRQASKRPPPGYEDTILPTDEQNPLTKTGSSKKKKW